MPAGYAERRRPLLHYFLLRPAMRVNHERATPSASTRIGRAAFALGVTSMLILSACAGGKGAASASATLGNSSSGSAIVRSGDAPNGMVVSASAIASEAGAQVLAAGGNAVDAAVATGFALAVTYPTAGNIGGGGFMVIRFPDGRSTTVDFREKAPLLATPEMFTDANGAYSATKHHRSHLSVGVPGTVAGFSLAQKKYGALPWKQLVDPAVKLAANGFVVPTGLAASLSGAVARLKAYPATVAAYSRNGTPYAAGERMMLPDLAQTLTRIRDIGRDGFYKGQSAALIVAEMQRGGGVISAQDLINYEAKERAPVKGTFNGYELISMAPPSSGGVAMVEMLNILEGYDLKAAGHNSPRYLHLLTESMRRAFLDRARFLGDPDFVRMPLDRLTSKTYAADLRKTISLDKASPSQPAQVAADHESLETTHFSVVDRNGMAVSITYTLEAGYGLGAVVSGAGFLLNNQMGDFNGKPGLTDSTGLIGTPANVAVPGKRMLSSMSPAIIAKDGKLVAVIGSPGGRTIINTVLQVALNIMAFGMPIQDAVNAPRIHHQWLPNTVTVERDGVPASTMAALTAMGHKVQFGGQQGTAHSVMIDPKTGHRVGAADPRDKDAGAVGH